MYFEIAAPAFYGSSFTVTPDQTVPPTNSVQMETVNIFIFTVLNDRSVSRKQRDG
jgi:hypothetical protein